MLRGKTERETLDLNGWTVGDILEGMENFRFDQILITAVGETQFLCRWKYGRESNFRSEKGILTTLEFREWRKIGRIEQ